MKRKERNYDHLKKVTLIATSLRFSQPCL